MRDCPTCGAAVDGLTCPICAHSEAGPVRPPRPDHWQCTDVDRSGARCARAGSTTESTMGSTLWWCADHFPLWRMRRGTKSPPPANWKPANLGKARIQPMRQISAVIEDELERIAIQSEGQS